MPTRRRLRRRSDRGAAMVEVAFVGVLLVLLVFGIITFGLLLSFDQDVTRAAAEGARVGAVATPPAEGTTIGTAGDDPRFVATEDATRDALAGFDQDCSSGAMSCNVVIHDCTNPHPLPGDVSYATTPDPDCVTVELVYDYDASPLIVEPPILSALLPDTISSKSVARLNQ